MREELKTLEAIVEGSEMREPKTGNREDAA